MKIAIAGRMASGKTTLAEVLAGILNGEVVSLGGKVKQVATDLFGMVEKDRPLLQQIGMKMREIRPDVWIEYLDREAEQSSKDTVIVDDCRFVNEARWFKDNGWTVVRLNIDESVQKERLMTTYPNDWEQHWNNRNDASEIEVAQIPDDWVDWELSGQETVENLVTLLSANL
jgi:dephospho-CoA kinase